MAKVPHERSLVKKMQDKPFVLLGVNSDKDREGVINLIAKEGITWRSWWDAGSTTGPIARAWNVKGWPVTYVFDHTGAIRYKNISGDELDEAVNDLLNRLEPEKAKSSGKLDPQGN